MEPKEIVNVKSTIRSKENLVDETKRGQEQREMAPGRRRGSREFCREQGLDLSFIGHWGWGGPMNGSGQSDLVLSWPVGTSDFILAF